MAKPRPNLATSAAMNILLLGSGGREDPPAREIAASPPAPEPRCAGGREHALAWKTAASPLTTNLWCAPGNAGIAQEAECVPLDIADHAAVVAFCKANKVDFVVVGPEAQIARAHV